MQRATLTCISSECVSSCIKRHHRIQKPLCYYIRRYTQCVERDSTIYCEYVMKLVYGWQLSCIEGEHCQCNETKTTERKVNKTKSVANGQKIYQITKSIKKAIEIRLNWHKNQIWGSKNKRWDIENNQIFVCKIKIVFESIGIGGDCDWRCKISRCCPEFSMKWSPKLQFFSPQIEKCLTENKANMLFNSEQRLEW